MAPNRRDLHKAKLRRDRIRRQKREQQAAQPAVQPTPPPLQHPFAMERSLREIQALTEGQQFESIDDANARLAELTGGGRLSERAAAWKRDDPKWRAQELAYDALETDDFVEALRLVNEALKLDPNCTDAQRLMVSLVPAEPENKLHLMREVVEKAEQSLGEDFFRDNMGHFWGTISTRPYMRAKQHLGELLVETGRLEEAIEVFERMLELNPGDNQGMRHSLAGLYLAAHKPDGAARLISNYPGEEERMGSFAWARVLERWLSADMDGAEAALARARSVNPFAEAYLSGARRLPDQGPEYYRPGEDSEARICALQLSLAMQKHPEFRMWLQERRPSPPHP